MLMREREWTPYCRVLAMPAIVLAFVAAVAFALLLAVLNALLRGTRIDIFGFWRRGATGLVLKRGPLLVMVCILNVLLRRLLWGRPARPVDEPSA